MARHLYMARHFTYHVGENINVNSKINFKGKWLLNGFEMKQNGIENYYSLKNKIVSPLTKGKWIHIIDDCRGNMKIKR